MFVNKQIIDDINNKITEQHQQSRDGDIDSLELSDYLDWITIFEPDLESLITQITINPNNTTPDGGIIEEVFVDTVHRIILYMIAGFLRLSSNMDIDEALQYLKDNKKDD